VSGNTSDDITDYVPVLVCIWKSDGFTKSVTCCL